MPVLYSELCRPASSYSGKVGKHDERHGKNRLPIKPSRISRLWMFASRRPSPTFISERILTPFVLLLRATYQRRD